MTGSLRAKGAGTIAIKNGHKHVRVSLPDGTRPWYTLCKIRLTGDCTCSKMSAAKLQETAHHVSERERERVLREMADALGKSKMTVRDFGKLWTSGKLYEQHGEVRGLKPKKSAHDDHLRLTTHVYPHIGDLKVFEVTEQDVERCLAKAARAAAKKRGKPWRASTRFQVFQVMRRLFELAVKPGRLRTDNPVSQDLRPAKDKPKLFSFLYPDELLALLGADPSKVALGRRVYYMLAVYTGLRKGSLLALKWESIDFKHRTLTSLESKTDLPQIFEIPEGLCTVLRRWHDYLGRPKPRTPIVRDLDCAKDREAETLRWDLESADVKRSVLFGGADNIEPLRFHDLRATFVTWARRQGRGWGWISDRTGHMTEEMQRRYDRGARMLADLQYTPFPELSQAIPELGKDPENVVRVDFKGVSS